MRQTSAPGCGHHRPMLRMSTMFLRTLREDPADAEVASHRLLVRAGYLRRFAPGIYALLPLGWRVFRNLERIVRSELDAVGSQEVHLPALLPREPYEASGRWTDYGDDMFRLTDRRGADYLLGPTHEEMFTLLAGEVLSSYRDLPVSIYQIQWKYRDEQRPRAGILRGREFAMADAYTFDIDEPSFQAAYDRHCTAFRRVFERLDLDVVAVAATSGAMGGSASEEFLLPLPSGEDTFVRCPACGYAANTEAVSVPAPAAVAAAGLPAAHVEDTPDTATIAELVDLFNARADLRRPDRDWTAADTLKNVVLTLAHPDGRREPLAIGVPGDREVDLKRLDAQLYPATAEPFTDADFAAHPTLVRGYLGPAALGRAGIRYLVDPRVADGTGWITGADEAGRHVAGLVAGRDFTADGVIEAAEVRSGDACPSCGAPLQLTRGLEVGHVFSLGRKYAEAHDLTVLDAAGKAIPVTMGSYGIGVTRLLAAVAEVGHDDAGLLWPASIAPADVHLVATGKADEIFAAAEGLAGELEAVGATVLYDDRRGISAGVKFADAELIGVPTVVIAGRGLTDGVVEVWDRRSGARRQVPLADAARELVPNDACR